MPIKTPNARRNFDDCKWFSTDGSLEKDASENPEAVARALAESMERHQKRMQEQEQVNPYSKKHHGGSDY